jgi:hypothetical protein
MLLIPAMVAAQNPPPATRPPTGIPRFSLDAASVLSTGPARQGAFLGDAGRRAALLGDESGSFEAWVWPLKLVRELRLAFKTGEMGEAVAGAALPRQISARAEGATE